jgi:hypothetical protein
MEKCTIDNSIQIQIDTMKSKSNNSLFLAGK